MLTIATAKYLHYAKALISSAKEHQTDAVFIVELINVDKKEEDDFRRRNPNCQILFDTMNPKLERNYCSNRKGSLMKRVRESGNSDLLMWIDADSIIRRSLSPAIPALQKDMCIRLKKTNKAVKGLLLKESYAGVFTFGNTPMGNKMLSEYQKEVDKNIYWGSDQDHLSYVYFCSKNASVGIIPDSLLDHKMKGDSVIWTLKCTPKTINGRFHREHRKYLEA